MRNEVIGVAAPSFFQRLSRELRLAFDVDNNVENAVSAMSDLRAVRDDLQRSPQQMRADLEQVDSWLNSVEEVNEKVAGVVRAYQNQTRCLWVYCSPNIFSSYSISRTAFQMLERVKALRREHDNLMVDVVNLPPASCTRRPVANLLVGKSPELLADLLSYLGGDEARIISICGMAGIGKSELMRRVNNSFLPASGSETAAVFKFIVWVDNAANPDVSAVQDEIAERLNLGDLGTAEGRDVEDRAGPIFRVLKEASFLVLLDNLMASVSLADLGIPNPVHRRRAALKQKVVLTTRFKGVCGGMNSCRRIDVECLDGDAAWRLFTDSVGGEEQIKGRETEAARLVASQCGGLPIALVKIGRAMTTRARAQPQEWRRTAKFLNNSQIHQIPGMERECTKLLQDLKQSYDHGVDSDRQRECFLCCALWPRGGSISKTELVDCWIGLGLIHEGSHDDTFQHGLSVIANLQDANLVLPVPPGPGQNGGDLGQVKLQEVVRDMALWIVRNCGMEWVVKAGVSLSANEVVELRETVAAAQRVSLMHSDIQEMPQSDHCTSPSTSRLALLMLQHNPTFTNISGAFLGSASALAYLDLSHTALEDLPEELGMLVMLEYLNLSFTPLKALPGSLRNLGRLKLLFLKHTTQLSTIPADVFRCLRTIRVIDMYPSGYMNWEEASISSFQFDHIMYAFIQSLGITTNSIVTVQRLGRLMNVCTRRLLMTSFHCPTMVTLRPSNFQSLMGSFSLLETLLELSITQCHTLEQLVLDGEEKQHDLRTRNDSWCLPKLVLLELCGLSNLAGIIWKNMSVSFFLGALLRAKIEHCNRLTNVTWVIQLPCLQHLELRDCATMESVVVVDADQEQPPTFQNLMTLVLVNLPVLSSISTQQVRFHCLRAIEVHRCAKLKVDPSLHKYYYFTQ
ncbi:unnamed protein product [Alopecurus aequalis]